MKTHLIAMLFIVITFSGCEKEDNNRVEYEVGINDQFQIDLVSNPSTGYSWKWTNKQAISIVDSTDYDFVADPDNARLIGGAGTEIWTFKGVSIGVDTIKLEYCQPWDVNSTIDSKQILIKVK